MSSANIFLCFFGKEKRHFYSIITPVQVFHKASPPWLYKADDIFLPGLEQISVLNAVQRYQWFKNKIVLARTVGNNLFPKE